MKRNNLLKNFAIALLSVFILSCGSDDDKSGAVAPTGTNPTGGNEDSPIELTIIENGVNIPGASKINGSAPSPNSTIEFQLNATEQDAFQGTGFNLDLSTSEAIAGAYVQFKDAAGNPTGSYFDVPSSAFGGKKGLFDDSRKDNSLYSKRIQNDPYEIGVSFESTVPVGEFCYAICIYNENGDISQPQTVCVTVKNWGGNASIAGDWIFDREEPNDDDEPDTVFCNSGGPLIVVDYFLGTESWSFTLNADGSYYEIYEDDGQYLDYEASQNNCEIVYGPNEQSINRYEGNWSFNTDDQTLTVVDFRQIDVLDPTNSEEYENGELYFEGVSAEVINNELVLSQEEEGILYKIIFKRR